MTSELERAGWPIHLPEAGPNGLPEELNRVLPGTSASFPMISSPKGHCPLDPAHEADRLQWQRMRGTLVGKKIASACTQPSNLWFDRPRLKLQKFVRQT